MPYYFMYNLTTLSHNYSTNKLINKLKNNCISSIHRFTIYYTSMIIFFFYKINKFTHTFYFVSVLFYYKIFKMLPILSDVTLLMIPVHLQQGNVPFHASIHLEQTWTYNFVYRQAILPLALIKCYHKDQLLLCDIYLQVFVSTSCQCHIMVFSGSSKCNLCATRIKPSNSLNAAAVGVRTIFAPSNRRASTFSRDIFIGITTIQLYPLTEAAMANPIPNKISENTIGIIFNINTYKSHTQCPLIEVFDSTSPKVYCQWHAIC
ncbi:hypothetical protein AGLY_014493 [Aphis glycines]|uniref:Uncharacterized protein n=1 Tax=Aphis glycines TaxID=307491 RepID=A0A6G0T3D0_APHGL|nr:hypothetical protein AGLY_014493 [Aphis glycines]